MHIYRREASQTLILCTSSEDEKRGCPSRCLLISVVASDSRGTRVEFRPKADVDFDHTVRLSLKEAIGCLGLINIDDDIFIVVVTAATDLGNLTPAAKSPRNVARINEIEFYCVNNSLYDTQTEDSSAYTNIDETDTVSREHAQPSQPLEHPCASLKSLVSASTFYFTPYPQWDISLRLSESMRTSEGGRDLTTFNEGFVWNEYLVASLLHFRSQLEEYERVDFDKCQLLILAIRGYVGLLTVVLSSPPTHAPPVIATLGLISRLSCKRAGTRFNARGIDDDGNCANFVESELLFSSDDHCFSHIQIRGSIPLFWEQQGFQTFQHRIQLTRSPAASQPTFERHFVKLLEEYSQVHAVNLLGVKETEALLTTSYSQHLRAAQTQDSLVEVKLTQFDFHARIKAAGPDSMMRQLTSVQDIRQSVEAFGFSSCDFSLHELITEQKGVFRVNCLDCLDRTNFVQDLLARLSLEEYLGHIRQAWTSSDSLWTNFRELWAENGDALSRIYAGTGALNTSYTRSGKRTLAGVLSDASKSVSRAYINNFQDKGKQQATDLFLGKLSNQKPVHIFDPIHETVNHELQNRQDEFSVLDHPHIFAGTWNLNGRPPAGSILPWIFPPTDTPEPAILAIAFQEIVPLTTQQILATDPSKKAAWEKHILECLHNRKGSQEEYIILRSEQLVGTALVILVKSNLIEHVRNVEGATRKTGLKGISGNKGGVGIRFDFHDTSFCFVTAHLAAGQDNVIERNGDYQTIASGLHFLRGKSIDSHDVIVWLADTNYRIDMENERIRELCEIDQYDALVASDQLLHAMDQRAAFAGYDEGPLSFRPTYKYDLYSDSYDTSEKLRRPAWTDRILFRGTNIRLLLYNRAELRTSDHRPVFAIFQVTLRIVDALKRDTLSAMFMDTVKNAMPGDRLKERLANISLANLNPSVARPSSDSSNWWQNRDHADGIYAFVPSAKQSYPKNPWDSQSSVISSPSSSDEELYTRAQDDKDTQSSSVTAHVGGARSPPVPPSRSTKPQA